MKAIIEKIYPYLKPYKKEALIAMLFAIPLALIKATEAYFIKDLFNKGLTAQSSYMDAFKYAGIIVGLTIFQYIFRLIHFYHLRMVVEKSCALMREKIAEKLQSVPLSFYSQSKQGETLSVVTNDTLLFSEGFRTLIEVIREPISILALLGVALYRDWQLTLVIFALAPIFILVLKRFGKTVKSKNMEVQNELASITHATTEIITGNKVIRSFNLQKYVNTRFYNSMKRYLKAKSKAIFIEENSSPMIELIGALGFAVVILIAHQRITHGNLTTGDFISFISAMALIMDPIRKFSNAQVNLSRSQAAGQRIWNILSLENEVNLGRKKIDRFSNALEIKNLHFSYDQNPVLKNINLTIKKGEKVGLVGLSGSGKSTLLNILLRFTDYKEGEILIDNVNIKEIDVYNYRHQFSYVGQNVFLFNDSVKENLSLGKKISDEEINEALIKTTSLDFVSQMNKGIESHIGDSGSKLSGGQAQRLTLARALIQKSPILLLDEATSALDNESEKTIQQTLSEISKETTVIAIAHRLSSLYSFDRLVVMKEGQIIEMGTHQELLQKNGEYFKLYSLAQD